MICSTCGSVDTKEYVPLCPVTKVEGPEIVGDVGYTSINVYVALTVHAPVMTPVVYVVPESEPPQPEADAV